MRILWLLCAAVALNWCAKLDGDVGLNTTPFPQSSREGDLVRGFCYNNVFRSRTTVACPARAMLHIQWGQIWHGANNRTLSSQAVSITSLSVFSLQWMLSMSSAACLKVGPSPSRNRPIKKRASSALDPRRLRTHDSPDGVSAILNFETLKIGANFSDVGQDSEYCTSGYRLPYTTSSTGKYTRIHHGGFKKSSKTAQKSQNGTISQLTVQGNQCCGLPDYSTFSSSPSFARSHKSSNHQGSPRSWIQQRQCTAVSKRTIKHTASAFQSPPTAKPCMQPSSLWMSVRHVRQYVTSVDNDTAAITAIKMAYHSNHYRTNTVFLAAAKQPQVNNRAGWWIQLMQSQPLKSIHFIYNI